MKALEFIKSNLRETLLKGLGDTLSSLKELLPKNSDKYHSLILLESQLNDLNKQRLRGTISEENLQLGKNRIRASLMDLINSIDSKDLDESNNTSDTKSAEANTSSQPIKWKAELIENETLDKLEFALFANQSKRSLRLILVENSTTQLFIDQTLVFSSSLNLLNGIVAAVNFLFVNQETINFEIEEKGKKYPGSLSFGVSINKSNYIKLKLIIDGKLIYASA